MEGDVVVLQQLQTAKPWRCGHHGLTERAISRDEIRAELRGLGSEHLRRIRGYSAVRLLERVGDVEMHVEIQPLLALHDQITRADRTDLPLA